MATRKQAKSPKKTDDKVVAILRDGTQLSVGDEVEAPDFDEKCQGVIFVVESITPYPACESGFLVVAHVKGFPDRRMLGKKYSGFEFPDGIDANWFKLLK